MQSGSPSPTCLKSSSQHPPRSSCPFYVQLQMILFMKAEPKLIGMVKCNMQIVIHISSGLLIVEYTHVWYAITFDTIPGLMGPAPPSVRWTCLMLDLEYMMSIYLKHCYHSLKSIKLCANMAVKNMFTTDLLLNPGDTLTDHQYSCSLYIYIAIKIFLRI